MPLPLQRIILPLSFPLPTEEVDELLGLLPDQLPQSPPPSLLQKKWISSSACCPTSSLSRGRPSSSALKMATLTYELL